jgi:AraC-like DNA-binding protein
MSLNSFLILFQQETGLPPQAWFRRKRLEQACKRLHFSEVSIEEIAEASGFCDRYHFSRAFKNAYAIGPAEYRQQAKFLRDAGKVQREN